MRIRQVFLSLSIIFILCVLAIPSYTQDVTIEDIENATNRYAEDFEGTSPAPSKMIIFYGWLKHGNTVEILGDDYLFTYETFKDLFVLENVETEERYILHDHECIDFGVNIEMCSVGKRSDLTLTEASVSENLDYIIPDAKIGVHYKHPDVVITRKISNKNPNLGDTITVSVSIENKGLNHAHNLMYLEEVPKEFDIISSKYSDNKFVWSGDVKMDAKIGFTYEIKVLEYFDGKVPAKASYVLEDKTINVLAKDLAIKTKKPLSITNSISKKIFEPNEQVSATLKITNNLNEEVPLESIYLKVPKGVSIISDKFMRDGERYILKQSYRELNPKQELRFDYTIGASDPGKYEITSHVDAMDQRKTFSVNATSAFTIDVDMIRINIEGVLNIPIKDKNETLKIFLYNKNDKSSLQNVIVNIKSDVLGNLSADIESLGKKEQKLVSEITYKIPVKPGQYPVSVSASYYVGTKRYTEKELFVIKAYGKELLLDEQGNVIKESSVNKTSKEKPAKEKAEKGDYVDYTDVAKEDKGIIDRIMSWFAGLFI